MQIEVKGVPKFSVLEFEPKKNKYCLCIPIINEGERIIKELERIKKSGVDNLVDIIICDGGSQDGTTAPELLKSLGVNTLLVKQDTGRLSAQLRMGYWWGLQRGYEGIITVDGNNKDSVESVPLFIEKLDEGYDLIQGSRFIKGGKAVNTPFIRHIAVTYIHAPIISIAAKHRFTDTTNGFRGYSKRYLEHSEVQPFREDFNTYELIAYLSVRATQLGMKAIEVPVIREYPVKGKTPTKISAVKGNYDLIKILFKTLRGDYNRKS
jgi:dolichol-phosphate mannosyltransferase